jgi:protoporphyrinogen oxidase
MKVGILGGGLTGLALGYFLQKNGIDFEILEKEAECGGLCRTHSEKGFVFDVAGGHIIFSKDNEVLNFMLDVLGENKTKVRRNTKIFYNGVYVKYPFENGLSDLSKEENEECLREFLKTLEQKYEKPKNFREWIYQTFGKGIADKYLIPYNKKIWNFELEKMATFWVDGRIPKPPAEDIIKSSKGIETEGYTHQLYFWYPKRGGIQAMIKEIENSIEVKITKNYDIRSIKKTGDRWLVSDGKTEKRYDIIISTIPIFNLAGSMKIPEDIKKTIIKLKYNSLITVNIGLDVDNLNDLSWLYIPDMKILTHRIVFLKNNSAATCPEGQSSVMAEITFNEGDNISRMRDDEIINHVIDGLHERGIIDRTKVIYTSVLRSKYAYVVYDIDYEKNIKTAREYFENQGIMLCGRFSEYQYLNMDACVRHAMDLVKKIKASS